MPRERVTLARITVNGSVRLTGERCFDLSLCRLGDEFVLFTEVHQQGSAQPANLAEIFFGVAAMVSNRCIDLIAGGYDKSHQCAEAVALHANLAGRLRQRRGCAYRFPDILSTGIAIIGPVKPQTVLPVCVRSDTKIDARFLPPEQVRRDRDEALGRKLIACRPDVGVNAEQLLENNHRRCRQLDRPRDVGAKRPVRRLDDNMTFHCALL
jgi:hypothetical protein